MAAVLGVVAVLGALWLVRSATHSGSSAPAGMTDSAVPDDSAMTGTGNNTHDSATTGTGNGTHDGGTTHNHSRRSISANGPRLDGADQTGGCRVVVYHGDIPATVNGVAYRVTSSPKPEIRAKNAAACGGPPCDGKVFTSDQDSCYVGADLAPGVEAGTYTIAAEITYSFVCDDTEVRPCSGVENWKGPPPTPRDPVAVSVSLPYEMSISVNGGGSPPAEDTSPSSTESAPAEDTSPSSDAPPSDSPASPASPENDDGRGPAATVGRLPVDDGLR
jgi:hypothetical protein